MGALWLAVLFCFFATQSGLAQLPTTRATAEIHGKVLLPGNIPAPVGAMVRLERAESGTVGDAQTDSSGKFEFRSLMPSTYSLQVRLHGYQPYQQYLDLTRETRAYVIVELTAVPGKGGNTVPSQGASSAASMRDAAIPSAAIKEFEKGKKLLLDSGDSAGSISHLNKAIRRYNNFPQAYVLLGVALGDQKKLPEAEEAFQQAIKLDSNAGDAYIALGSLLNQEKKFADAERQLTRAVELKPDSFPAHYELGKSYWARQRNEDAEPHAEKALALAPNSAEAHVLMGNILLRKRDNAGALREFKTSLNVDPKNPYAEATRQLITRMEGSGNSSPQ